MTSSRSSASVSGRLSVAGPFERALYDEHVEEGSFLFEQRRALLADDSVPWPDLEPFEWRLEAHLDALVLGREEAWNACSDCVPFDDGVAFVATAIACRDGRSDGLRDVLQRLDLESAAQLRAVAESLRDGLPRAWEAAAIQALAAEEPRLGSVLADVAHDRRWPVHDAIASRVLQGAAVAEPFLLLLSAAPSSIAIPPLLACLGHDDPAQTAGAEVALALAHARCPLEVWPGLRERFATVLPFALTDHRAAARSRWASVERHPCSDDILLLGWMGDVAALDTLVAALQVDGLADAAATALYWLTGADLLEDVAVEEPMDEAEAEALERWRQPQPVHRPPRETIAARSVQRRCRDTLRWEQWLARWRPTVDPSLRYRRGRLHSPTVLLDDLADASSDRTLRRWSAFECVTRYAAPVLLDTRWSVVRQRSALLGMRAWAVQASTRAAPGAWCLGGEVQTVR